MQVGIRVMFPMRIADGESNEIILEENITDFPVFSPTVMFYNVSADDVDYQIVRALTIGTSTDPLLAGTYNYTLVNTTVTAGETNKFQPEHEQLIQPGEYPQVLHTITVTNNSGNEIIAYVIVTGQIWDTLARSPSSLPLIR